VILNLVQKEAETTDIDIQPFAENYLTLHTESSTKTITEQPRYIVLMCIEAPGLNSGGQTIVVPMSRIYEKLNKDHIDILSKTRYREHLESPPFFYWREGRPLFSFRDFGNQALDWCFEDTSQEITERIVNDTIRSLLEAMYEPVDPFGIHWSYGMLIILDNTFYFHGKTFGQIVHHQPLRRLKRLRIRSH
jgi:alpha-ketoglutarate-dependent taurine dioxygenase